MTSLNKFSKAWASLKTLLHRTSKDGYEFIIIGDVNIDIKLDSVRTVNLLDSLPDYTIIAKGLSFSHVHHYGSLSDINHVICPPFTVSSTVHVHEDEQDTDQPIIAVLFD